MIIDTNLITELNSQINDFVWGPYMLIFMVGTGIYLSIRLGFPQFKHLAFALRNTIGKMLRKDSEVKGAMTPFQSVSTALASTVGTGNIAGVTGAIILGGPGAVFWMWLSGLFGMCTKYCEVTLALKYREKNKNGDWVGGPMYYIKNGLNPKMRFLAILFAIFGAVCCFGIGNLTQINSISTQIINVVNVFGDTRYTPYEGTGFTIALTIGVMISFLAAFCIVGGISKIGKVTEKMVPTMVAVYLVCAIVVILANFRQIPHVLYDIFYYAFKPEALMGGAAGTGIITFMNCIQKGVARGVFSNEAGLGSAPMAHATSSETKPHKQGLYGIFEVFVSTMCICTLTAFVVLTSGVAYQHFGAKEWADSITTAHAFQSVFGDKAGSLILATALFMFAASTILGWALYGVRCAEYLFGPKIIRPYEILFCAVIVLGSVTNLKLVWDIADTLNGLMAIPNLIALLMLSPWLAKYTKEYFNKYDNDYEKASKKADLSAEKAIIDAEKAIVEATKIAMIAQATKEEAEKALKADGDDD